MQEKASKAFIEGETFGMGIKVESYQKAGEPGPPGYETSLY